MFKKIVSNLPFSPALVGQLGFYARRLRKEEITRRTGLVLTALALVVQSLVVFNPPEAANAASSADIIRGGVHTKSQLLSAWDKNRQGFRDLMKHAGITRDNLKNSKETSITSRKGGKSTGWESWGRKGRFSAQQGEYSFNVGSQRIYSRPLANFDTGSNRKGNGSYYKVFAGTNSKGQSFVILKDCANPAFKVKFYPPKNIKVCELKSKKIITIKENQFDKNKHSKNLKDCEEKPKPTPVAACSGLAVQKVSRTSFRMTASASASNGASIKGYTFTIKDKDGKVVKTQRVNTAAKTASFTYNLPSSEARYTATVTVHTSAGDKTGANCQAVLSVAPLPMCPINPNLPVDSEDCKPCPGNPDIWVKDDQCDAKVIQEKSASMMNGGDVAKDKAKPSDRIEYKLSAKNDGLAPAKDFVIKDDISDILEYADVIDANGGTVNDEGEISWPATTIAPGKTEARTFLIKVKDTISSMSQGTGDPTSYDCRMTNTFGNTVNINVECPQEKVVEQVVSELPRTGPGANMIIAGIAVSIIAFFYARSRQLNKEVRLVRRELNAGTIA